MNLIEQNHFKQKLNFLKLLDIKTIFNVVFKNEHCVNTIYTSYKYYLGTNKEFAHNNHKL